MAWWRSEDQGETWELEREVTRGSALNHTYARRPLHAHDPFYAFWADGNPDTFSPSSIYFTDSAGRRIWRLPETMDGEEAEPVCAEPCST